MFNIRRYMFIAFVLSSVVTTQIYAEPHSHSERSHIHPLPAEGFVHRHGIGALGYPLWRDCSKVSEPFKVTCEATNERLKKQRPAWVDCSKVSDSFKKECEAENILNGRQKP